MQQPLRHTTQSWLLRVQHPILVLMLVLPMLELVLAWGWLLMLVKGVRVAVRLERGGARLFELSLHCTHPVAPQQTERHIIPTPYPYPYPQP
jgi:hypothetical protein